MRSPNFFQAMLDRLLLHQLVMWVVDWGKLYLQQYLSPDLTVK